MSMLSMRLLREVEPPAVAGRRELTRCSRRAAKHTDDLTAACGKARRGV
jgi:hypothetical protein